MENTDPGPHVKYAAIALFRDPRLMERLRPIWIPCDRPLEPVPSEMRPAAVLMPFQYLDGHWVLYFIKRSERVEHHRGQMAFPGGEVEAQDKDVYATALRETAEEIGLLPENINILGRLPASPTVTRYWIYPIAGAVKRPWQPSLSDEEVEALVAVPLAHLFDPRNYRQERHTWRGQTVPVHVFLYGSYRIWGATARILDELLRRIAASLGLDLAWLPHLTLPRDLRTPSHQSTND